MSRSGYSDDCENIELYRGAVRQAVKGKRGQAFLRELATAMDAMPDKRLISDALVEGGEFCAIGTVGAARGIDMSKIDYEEPASVAKAFGIARCLAAEIEFINDDDFSYGRVAGETPEQRWERVRKWVQHLLDGGDPN